MTWRCPVPLAIQFFLPIRFTFVRRLYVPKFSSIPCIKWDLRGVVSSTSKKPSGGRVKTSRDNSSLDVLKMKYRQKNKSTWGWGLSDRPNKEHYPNGKSRGNLSTQSQHCRTLTTPSPFRVLGCTLEPSGGLDKVVILYWILLTY